MDVIGPRASARAGTAIPLYRPAIGEAEVDAVARVLRAGSLIQGAEVEAFERALAARVGAVEAIAVSSGTAALHLALRALGVGPGDEVVVPAFTFIATANAAAMTGAEVVLADVRPDSLCLCPESVRAVRRERTRAVVPVHALGLAADLEALREAARGLEIVEDAAAALGARTAAGPVGGGGSLTAFSFHARKTATTGEGGAITTADARLSSRLRSLRQHGLTEGTLLEPSLNWRLSELQAALGRVQLGRLDELLACRLQAAGWYRAALADLGWLRLPPGSVRGAEHTYQSFLVWLDDDAPIGRDALVQGLLGRGIGCQAGGLPVHRQRAYQAARRTPLPVSERLGERALFLPMFPSLRQADIFRVAEAIRAVARGAP